MKKIAKKSVKKSATKSICLVMLIAILLLGITSASAAEIEIFSNEEAGSNANSLILDQDSSGGNVDLVFGNAISEYLRHDGSLFHLSDDLLMDNSNSIQFRDSDIAINSSIDGQMDIDADVKIEVTTPLLDLNGTLDSTGITSTGTVDFSGSDSLIIRQDSDPATNAACTTVGEIIYDTTDLQLQHCTSTGAAGAATWVQVEGSGSHTQNTDYGTIQNTFTLDMDDTGGNVDLIFGTTIGQYLRHDGTFFHFSDDMLMDGANSIQFRDVQLAINSSVDGQMDIDADTELEITSPLVDIIGNLNVEGSGELVELGNNSASDIIINFDDDEGTYQQFGWDDSEEAFSTYYEEIALRTYQGTVPPLICNSLITGMQWMDTETGINYSCDTSNGRSKWLSIGDLSEQGAQPNLCSKGDDLGDNEDCGISMGDRIGLGGDVPQMGLYLPYPATITGYGFSMDSDLCLAGSFDIEVWSTGSNSDDNNYSLETTVAAGLTGEVYNSNSLNVDLNGDQYYIFGLDNNCNKDLREFSINLYYRWRHE